MCGSSLRGVDESASLGYGMIPFPGVSSASASADDEYLDLHVGGEVFFCYLVDCTLSYYILLMLHNFLHFSCFL